MRGVTREGGCKSAKPSFVASILRWVDADAGGDALAARIETRVEWVRIAPFIFLHLMCLGVIWVGWSWVAVAVAAVLYVVRMFAITGFYHRYFSHRSFQTNRVLAVHLRGSRHFGRPARAAVVGLPPPAPPPLRGQPTRTRTPRRGTGFWWSHVGWLVSARNFSTRHGAVSGLAALPGAAFGSTASTRLVPLAAGAEAATLLGDLLERYAPGARNQRRGRCWSGASSSPPWCCSTRPCTINSLAHMVGSRRYETRDTSRNNCVAGAAHARRRLAQQPSPLPELRPPGLLLVGDRHDILRPRAHVRPGNHVGAAAGTRACAPTQRCVSR